MLNQSNISDYSETIPLNYYNIINQSVIENLSAYSPYPIGYLKVPKTNGSVSETNESIADLLNNSNITGVIPSDLKYTKDHEWVRVDGDVATVGITDFAQGELGDIVYVDIDTVDENLDQNEVFGSVEAVKTVSASIK